MFNDLMIYVFFLIALGHGLVPISFGDSNAILPLMQALCQAMALPFWAALADGHAANRKTLLALTAIAHGIFACSLAAAGDFVVLLLLCCLNSIAMASLRSVGLGLLAEAQSFCPVPLRKR